MACLTRYERSWGALVAVVVAFALLFALLESAVASPAPEIDRYIRHATARGDIPGCVVVAGRSDGVTFRRAYGRHSVRPAPTTLGETAIFDLASLTKPIATASTVVLLSDLGILELDMPVASRLPAFSAADKAAITPRMLLTHTSGLPAASPQTDYDHGLAQAVVRIAAQPLVAQPGERYLYSDLGYVVLGALVERATERDLAALSREAVFSPLGMDDAGFLPHARSRERVVPTEHRNGVWIQGAVHDPRAARLGGVAGHAGLFSTADDLARFARALLNHGELDGVRVWSASAIDEMLHPQGEAGHSRALGWDVVRIWDAELGRSRDTLAHGGFTGTYVWLDPERDLFFVFLSSRLHPNGRGRVHELVAQLRGAFLATTPTRRAPSLAAGVSPGIDVLRSDGFRLLEHQRVALVTHAAAVTRDGARTADLLHDAPNVRLVALFTPEHGLGGDANGAVADARDQRTGLAVHSLYGPRRAPTRAQLAGVDTIVVDLQDAGVRFYTYFATLREVMGAAAKHGKKVVVLDRPNPIGGERIEGPLPDTASIGLFHPHPVPIRHGMTLGELALLIDQDEALRVQPIVVRARGWQRSMLFSDTGLTWSRPSPNLRSPDQALLYPSVALLEMTNVSVGRGTATPFEVVGAPWADERLAARLASLAIPGIAFESVTFTPSASTHAGRLCHGARLRITDAGAFRAMPLGLGLAVALRDLYGPRWDDRQLSVLLASRSLLQGLRAGRSLPDLLATSEHGIAAFAARRAAVLQYR